MSSVNKVILVGNLGADPEIRYTQGGQAVCNLRIATSENWNDRDGNRQERTEWHSVSVWGKQAEICGQYLAKGRKVYLEGRLQSREYTDREGVNRRAWDVVANNVVFLSGRDVAAAVAGAMAGKRRPRRRLGRWSKARRRSRRRLGRWPGSRRRSRRQLGRWPESRRRSRRRLGRWRSRRRSRWQLGRWVIHIVSIICQSSGW